MPSALTYPGVYVEEVPSGVRTIAGVSTSVTAFIGRTARGHLNTPTTLFSWGDYERQFGGLQLASPLSYAVRDFFLNGGSQALVVRLVSGTGTAASAAAVSLATGAAAPNDALRLIAASPGGWGNNVSVRTNPPPAFTDPLAFNLYLSEAGGAVEQFLNVSVDPASPRFVTRVLAASSTLALVDPAGTIPNVAPSPTPAASASVAFAGGVDSGPLVDNDYNGSSASKTGIYALDKADLFNLLCIPPDSRSGDTSAAVYATAMSYCFGRRAVLIVDPPAAWTQPRETAAANAVAGLAGLNLSGEAARNAVLYFPRVVESDPLRQGQLDVFAASGAIAGVIARTDGTRGVWKAPAGLDAALNGVQGLDVNLNNGENGLLNPLGINVLRSFPVGGRVIWGARTLRGADQLADDYKYLSVRRVALYIEESLSRGTQWVVFEPNDEPLWSQIRLNVGAFMQNLFRQGAFQGSAPKDAYFVKCDSETTTQNDINLGVVNILVGFAPLKPAEFVVIRLQQLAGQITA